MVKDIFENFREEDNPPYQQWILDEAHGNLELADLIEQREILFEAPKSEDGVTRLRENREEFDAQLGSIYEKINEIKERMGIDLPEED